MQLGWKRFYFEGENGAGAGASAGASAPAAPATPAAPAAPSGDNGAAAAKADGNRIVEYGAPTFSSETTVEQLKNDTVNYLRQKRGEKPIAPTTPGAPPPTDTTGAAGGTVAQPGQQRGPDGRFLPAGGQPAAAATTPATSPTPPAGGNPPSAPPSAFPDQAYNVGQQLGLTRQQVESFGTPAQFEGWLTRIRSVAQQAAQPRMPVPQLTQPQPQQQFPQQQPGQLPGQQQQQQQQLAGFQPFQLAEPENYDPQIVALVNHQNQTIQQLHQMLAPVMQFLPQGQQMIGAVQQFQQHQQAMAQANLRQQLDEHFGTLDEKLFGKGPADKIGPAELNARVQASAVMARLEAGYQMRGEALPPLQTLAQQAYQMAWPDKVRERVLSEAAEKSKSLRQQTTASPTARQRGPVPETEAAQAAIRAFYREHGEPV